MGNNQKDQGRTPEPQRDNNRSKDGYTQDSIDVPKNYRDQGNIISNKVPITTPDPRPKEK